MGVTVAEMLRRFQQVDLVEEAGDIITGNPNELVDLNRQQLFVQGEDATGARLGRYKSDRYAKKKALMNPLPGLGNPDFYLTGAFQKEMYVEVRGDRVIFNSTSEVTDYLIKRDGAQLFGLTPESKVKYRPELLTAIVRRMKIKTGAR